MDARRAPREGGRRVPAHRRSTCSRRSRRTPSSSSPATFPTNNAIANLLLGAPVTFYQGLGDFSRGLRRVGRSAATRRTSGGSTRALTLNYGLRYERINPITEVEDRLTGFVPGVQSSVRPDAPRRARVPRRCRASAAASRRAPTRFMPRVGVAWDPTGAGIWSVRSSYGLFYDQFQNGAGTASQVPVSSHPLGAVQSVQRRRPEFPEPVPGRPYPAPDTFVRPSTVFTIDADAKPPYAQNWNVSVAAVAVRHVPGRGALRRRAGRSPAAQHRSESGGVRARRDGAECRSPPHLRQLSRRRRHLRLLDHRDALATSRARSTRGQVERVAAVLGRRRLQRVVLVFEDRSTSCRR